MKVLLIREDNHGVIGIAKDYDSAINFISRTNWLGSGCDEEVYAMSVEEFNDTYGEAFYLEWYNVEGT